MSGGPLNRSFILAHRVAMGESWLAGLESWIDGIAGSRLPRRHFLGISTLGVSTLLADQSEVRVERSRGRVAFLLGGRERWVIDERYFAGHPRLTWSEDDQQAIELELRGALFPGTDVPADVNCRLDRTGGTWRAKLAFRWGNWQREGDFLTWLRGERAAAGSGEWSGSVIDVFQTASLQGGGKGQVEFSPEWKFALEGPGIARIEGLGCSAVCQRVVFGLDGKGAGSLINGNGGIRTKAVAIAGREKWSVPEPFSLHPSLHGTGGQFETALLEATEDRLGRRQAALMFEPPAGDIPLSALVGDEWRSSSGERFTLPLQEPRIALAARDEMREALLLARFPATSEAAYSGGLRARFGAADDTPAFELALRNGRVITAVTEPAVLAFSAPLKDSVTETCLSSPDADKGCVTSTQRKDSWNFWRGFIPPFRAWRPGPAARPGGTKTQWGIPLNNYALRVARPQDLLLLTFRFKDLYLKTRPGKAPSVTPSGTKEHYRPGYLIIELPPQSIIEQAFYERDDSVQPPVPAGQPLPPPIQSRISGASRLVFEVDHPIDYSLDGLLDWGKLKLVVPGNALRPDEEPAELKNTIAPPGALETALEIPYRLFLSPHKDAVWMHHRKLVCDAAGRVEMWNTRLTVRGKGGAPDESSSAGRTVRAVWSPDYPAADKPLPTWNAFDPFPNPTLPSLIAQDRYQIVRLTSDYSIDQHNDGGRVVKSRMTAPVVANRFAMSALGAWLDLEGHWNPLAVGLPWCDTVACRLNMIEWLHRATFGRDNFVRVIEKGYMFPIAIPAALVKETERKFDWNPDTGQWTAYLRKKYYIKWRVPRRDYSLGLGLPFGGRWTSFQAIDVDVKHTTPYLDPADTSNAFWPMVGGKDYVFQYLGYDPDNQPVSLRSPLMFVPSSAAFAPASIKQLFDNYGREGSRRQVALGGQTIALVPSTKPDSDRLPAEYHTWLAVVPDATKIPNRMPPGSTDDEIQKDKLLQLEEADQPPFYPVVDTIRASLPQLSKLTGKSEVSDLQFHPLYIEKGFDLSANRGEIYAELRDTPGQGREGKTYLTFGGDGNANGDKAGGLATPNSQIVALSRRLGPVGGKSKPVAPGSSNPMHAEVDARSLLPGRMSLPPSNGGADGVASGKFDVADFLGGGLLDSKLFGVIALKDIVAGIVGAAVDNLGEAPKVLQSTFYDAEAAILKVVREAVDLVDNEFTNLPAPLKARLQNSWQAVPTSLAAIKPGSKEQFEQMGKFVESLKRVVDECRRIANDPISAFSADLAELGQRVLGDTGLFSVLRQFIDARQKLNDILTVTATYQNTFADIKGSLTGLSDDAKAELDGWVNELQALRLQVANSLAALGKELEQSAQDFKKANLALVLNLVAQFHQDLNTLQQRAEEIVNSLQIPIQSADTAKAVIEQALGRVVQTVQKTDQVFRASFEKVIQGLQSGVASRVQDLKAKVLATSRELEKAALATGQDLGRRELALERDFIDGLRRIRDAVPADATVVLALDGLPAEIQFEAAALEISPTERAAITALAGAQPQLASATVTVRAQLEAWGLSCTQLQSLVRKVQANPQAIKNDLAQIGNQVAGQLKERITTEVETLSNRARDLVANLAADPLTRGAAVLDSLDVVRDRSVVVLMLAGSVPSDLTDRIVNAKKGVLDSLKKYEDDLQNEAGKVADLLDGIRSATPKELQPLLDALIENTSKLLRQFQAGTKHPADLPALASVLREAIDKLFKLLSDPLNELPKLVNFRDLAEKALVKAGIPQSQTFSYSWSPRLQSTSGGDKEALFFAGPYEPDHSMGTLTIVGVATVPLRPNVQPQVEITGTLTRVTVNLLPNFPIVSLPFKEVKFTSKTGEKTNVTVSLGDVQFLGALTFVKKLEDYLNPSSGPFLELRPTGILAGFRFSLPALTLGAFNVLDLRFFASIAVYFDGRPLRLELGVSDFADPFTVSSGILGGRGYFFMALTAAGLQEMDGAFELGAVAELNLAGIARGRGYLMVGVHFRMAEVWSFYIFSCDGGSDELSFRDFDLEFFQEFGVFGHFLT